jgi:hypothetical protein
MSQKNIQEYFQEYFFENFKGGRGGSGCRGKSGDKKETGREYMLNYLLF